MQGLLTLHADKSFKSELERIRLEARDNSELGRWFENLVMRMLRHPDTEYRAEQVWRWSEWPDRERLTNRNARDLGIDLVVKTLDGELVAVQCKCYDSKHALSKSEINSFLTESQRRIPGTDTPVFEKRWLVLTCEINRTARIACQDQSPQVAIKAFDAYSYLEVGEEEVERPVRAPWALQADAIDAVTKGLKHADRGMMIMACGTGKTFVSLRIAEHTVPDGGTILFAAPSIALVNQSRSEWLRHSTRPLSALVVCSDASAGGRHEEDLRVSDMVAPVTTDPIKIQERLRSDKTTVVFATYQSLNKVLAAQEGTNLYFDLAIADEAHRTTGYRHEDKNTSVDFQAFHDKLNAHKRLYMTATPRIYRAGSKSRMEREGADVFDMERTDTYGHVLHQLDFEAAVKADMLSEYRVILLGVNRKWVGEDLKKRLNEKRDGDLSRGQGVLMAVSGGTHGHHEDGKGVGVLSRTLVFASSIERSKWFANQVMQDAAMKGGVSRQLTTQGFKDNKALTLETAHVDGSDSAFQRQHQLKLLREADKTTPRMISNCKLFTEGVDVPNLEAVAFFDPRDSEVDIVQAVGRVMRKAEGKTFGYIIVPVVLNEGASVEQTLDESPTAFATIGKVLRALRSHDPRIYTELEKRVMVVDPDKQHTKNTAPTTPTSLPHFKQGELPLGAPLGLYAKLAKMSGLRNPNLDVADDLAETCRVAGQTFYNENLGEPLALALDRPDAQTEADQREACTTAALILTNACLLHRRLRKETALFDGLTPLVDVQNDASPAAGLQRAWKHILTHDYRPVFAPAFHVVSALTNACSERTTDTLRGIIGKAVRQADRLSTLGYDYAGPLYHKILSTAKSDGAFYTKNTSALLLAGLALPPDNYRMWKDSKRILGLTVFDPACGTGTLLMASLATIKRRARLAQGDAFDDHALHKAMVETGIHGMDINTQAIQMAASNLTIGATSVDYQRMNLHTLPHGTQPDGNTKAGALELLVHDEPGDLFTEPPETRRLGDQVDGGADVSFPAKGFDVVIMNPPFTNATVRGTKYTSDEKKKMQKHELDVKATVKKRFGDLAAESIHSGSIGSYFEAIGHKVLSDTPGATLAMVFPITKCTSASGGGEDDFWRKSSILNVWWYATRTWPKTQVVHQSGSHQTKNSSSA